MVTLYTECVTDPPVIVEASVDGVELLAAPGALALPVHYTLLVVGCNGGQWKAQLALGANHIGCC